MPPRCELDHRRGVCREILRFAKTIPVLFISAIVVWSYYAYVVRLCIGTVQVVWEMVIMLVLFHFFFFMFVWAYWKTVFTPPGSVPVHFMLSSEEMERIEASDNPRIVLEQIVIAKDLPCTMRSFQQEIRYCSECSIIKPDRAHHCGVCGQCVLKMDHHCPWVNNCVAFMNYKYFVLFLGYALLYCIYVATSSLKYFLQFWSLASTKGETGSFHVLFLFFVSSMFSISVGSLFFYHLYLVSRNMTTLESFRTPIFRHGPDRHAFHLGRLNNFQEVFGDNKITWFLPVFSSFGDGITFPQRGQLDEEAGLLEGVSPSNTTGEYASEEMVPMMLQEKESGNWSDTRHVSSSSGSSETDILKNGTISGNSKFTGSSGNDRINHTPAVGQIVEM